jgi:hydroxymethylglutaryl-CoA synthase
MAVGIIGYGAYLPQLRITGKEIAQAWSTDWEKIFASTAVFEKTVPAIDEDTTTISVAAALNALARAEIAANSIDAIFVGSESHPYAVKPTATIVGNALGINQYAHGADLEFACKAGTAALITCYALVASKTATYALALGADTAQAAPGDVLEYTAAAGGAAFVVGADIGNSLAIIEHSCSITTDTPDFWRRPTEIYPEHMGRFTAEPSYFYHIESVTLKILSMVNLQPHDIDYVVFHQPNARFPVVAASRLGFAKDTITYGHLAPCIGNTYSAATLLGLTAILDQASSNQRILVVSYGSGSGADALLIHTTDRLAARRTNAPKTNDYITKKRYITYQHYRHIMSVLHGE